jgi:hypothetical protein
MYMSGYVSPVLAATFTAVPALAGSEGGPWMVPLDGQQCLVRMLRMFGPVPYVVAGVSGTAAQLA